VIRDERSTTLFSPFTFHFSLFTFHFSPLVPFNPGTPQRVHLGPVKLFF
jgi:hypothetical protein